MKNKAPQTFNKNQKSSRFVFSEIKKYLKIIYKDFIKVLKFIYSPIVFFSGVGNSIANAVRNYTNRSPLNFIGSQIKSVISKLYYDLKWFAKILYSPVSIIIIIGKIWLETIKQLDILVKKFASKIKSSIVSKYNDLFPDRNRKRFEKYKRRLFFTKNETFLNSNIYQIVLITTLGLQIISFFTTFRGSLTFFEGVHWIAPLLFTGILQLLLWVLANVAFSKRRRHAGRVAFVVCVCLISAFLSYVGIANSSLPPTDEYKTVYNSFSESYNSVLDSLELKSGNTNVDKEISKICKDIKDLFDYANKNLNISKSFVNNNKNNTQKQFNSKYDENGNRIYDENGNPVGEWIYNSNYEAIEADITNHKNNIIVLDPIIKEYNTTDVDNLENQVKNINIDFENTGKSYKETILDIKETNSDVFENYNKIISNYNRLVNYFNVNSQIPYSVYSEDLSDLFGNQIINLSTQSLILKTFDEIKEISNSEISSLYSDKPQKIEALYNLLLQGTERPQLSERVLQNTKNEIETKYTNLENTVKMINKEDTNNLFNNLKKQKSQINLPDSYTYAISHISNISKNSAFKIILMIFFALLVDGLTLLIPLLVEKRRESVLFAKSTQDILYDQEDVLENLLLTCALSNDSANTDESDDENTYTRMMDTLTSYIKLFRPSPATKELGYPKCLRVSDNSLPGELQGTQQKDKITPQTFNEISSVLLEMGYIKFVSRKEYYLLKCDYYNIQPTEKSAEPDKELKDVSIDAGYYLLKGQFVLWMNDNSFAWFGHKSSNFNLDFGVNNKPNHEQSDGKEQN